VGEDEIAVRELIFKKRVMEKLKVLILVK